MNEVVQLIEAETPTTLKTEEKQQIEQTQQTTKPNTSEIIAQMQYENKRKVIKILKKPNYFKCREYIGAKVRRDINKILTKKQKPLEFLPYETYTQYKRRVVETKTIMS